MIRLALGSVTVVSVVLISMGLALASPPMLTKAKQAGLPVQNCQYCHVSKLPKKDGFTPQDLNERGTWLMTEKDTRKAKDIDVDWLKAYPGGKEQK